MGMEHDSTAEYDTANEYIETMETSKQVWEAPNDFALTSDSTSIRLKSVRRGNPLYQSSALELDDSTGTTATSGGSNSKATGDSRAMEHDSTAEYDTANEYIETMETSKQVWEAPNDFALTSDSTSIRLKSVRR